MRSGASAAGNGVAAVCIRPRGLQAAGHGISVLVGVPLESCFRLPFLPLGTDAMGPLHLLPASSNATEVAANSPGNLLRFSCCLKFM